MRRKPNQYALHFNEQEHTSFCYSLLLGQYQLKLLYYGKGRQNFVSNVTLYPCERSRQNHLVVSVWTVFTIVAIEIETNALSMCTAGRLSNGRKLRADC